MDVHKAQVSKLALDVEGFYVEKKPFWIYHGSTNCTRTITLDRSRIVDTSSLNHVLEIDTYERTALVEPNVPMDALVRETLRHNLIPPVVPEFPGITVGGAFSGTAGESSSFKYGYFDRIVNKVEIILANGELTTATPDGEKKDLFNAAAGSCGTMGVTTLFEVQLVPAKKFVELTYIPVASSADAIATLKCCTAENKTFDFVDGIQFSKTQGVVCVGMLTDKRTYTPRSFSGPWDPWFYMHARGMAEKGTKDCPRSDTIPLVDYFFRYDRGAFWMGAYYPLFPYKFMNNTLSRWFWDSFLHTRVLFQSMHISNRSQKFIIQDLGLPSDTANEFLEYVDDEFGIYPLWLCPLKTGMDVNMQRVRKSDLTINIGVWGPGPDDFSTFVRKNRDLERKLKDLGGLKWLYAHTYYTVEEFWSIYNKKEYDEVRRKYNAESLPNVYTKVKSTEVEHPQQDLKATWHGLYGHLLGYPIQYLLSGTK